MLLDSVKSIFNKKGLLFICRSIKDWFIGLFTLKKLNNALNCIINTIKSLWKIIINLFLLMFAIVIVLLFVVLMVFYMIVSFIAKLFKITGTILLWIGNIIDIGLHKVITMIDIITNKIKSFVEREESLNESNATINNVISVSDANTDEK